MISGYRPKILTTILLEATLILVASCIETDKTVFDHTIAYYKQSGNYLKVKAAEYLRDNAQWHYGVPRFWTDSLGRKTDDIDYRKFATDITTYYWSNDVCWHAVRQDAELWGLNEKTGEYRLFNESMRGEFKPVFHLLQVRLPAWTVFFDDETPRPLGFICKDPESGEGYFMQF